MIRLFKLYNYSDYQFDNLFFIKKNKKSFSYKNNGKIFFILEMLINITNIILFFIVRPFRYLLEL
jgi:hypothetical protein